MGKPQSGVTVGNLAWFGSYGECLNITGAQYCLASIKINIGTGNKVSTIAFKHCGRKFKKPTVSASVYFVACCLPLYVKYFPCFWPKNVSGGLVEQEMLWNSTVVPDNCFYSFLGSPELSRVFLWFDRNIEKIFFFSFRNHHCMEKNGKSFGHFDHQSVNYLCLRDHIL